MLVPYARKNHSVSTFNPFHDFDDLERAFFSDNALSGIKAAYNDGVLCVTLPKQKEVPATSRRLEIE